MASSGALVKGSRRLNKESREELENLLRNLTRERYATLVDTFFNWGLLVPLYKMLWPFAWIILNMLWKSLNVLWSPLQ
jgi:hypothetical protein